MLKPTSHLRRINKTRKTKKGSKTLIKNKNNKSFILFFCGDSILPKSQMSQSRHFYRLTTFSKQSPKKPSQCYKFQRFLNSTNQEWISILKFWKRLNLLKKHQQLGFKCQKKIKYTIQIVMGMPTRVALTIKAI